MKKSIFAVLVAVLLLGVTNVNAMTKAQLQAKIEKGYKINGVTYLPTADQKVQIDRYFAENTISDSDAAVISNNIDTVVAVLEENKVTDLSKDTLAKLPAEAKTKITNAVDTISTTANVTIDLAENGNFTVKDKKGILNLTVGDSLVKKTNNNNVIVVSSLVSLVGIAFVARKFF